jgi:phenylpropionate dioxygenase-like ring-hydroxylating dioxygenase large terminal subunit
VLTYRPPITDRRSPIADQQKRRRDMTAALRLDDGLLVRLDESIRPVGEASTLPPELYTSRDVLAFEGEALFAHDWLCVGRADRVANVGDWFTKTILDEPIVIVRDKAGEIRAMSAVCQHRAMQVCEGAGNSTTFKCPYHHWNYALDGRLLGAPAMEQTIDFDKGQFGLPQLRVELWQGFVFVNFDPAAAPLAPTLDRYSPLLANFDLDDVVCPGTFTLEGLPWNWKVMFENFNDGYHANRLHQFVQDFCPSSMTGFPIEWDDDSNVIFRTAGYTHIDGGFNATHRTIMPVFPKLTDEERSRSTFALVPPTLCFGTAPDQCFFFLVWPTGPETIDLEIGYLFHPSALDDPLFEQKLELSDVGVQVFVRQDQDATTKVQRGLRSRFAPRGRYSWQEESHVQFNRWLVQRYRRHQPEQVHS